MPSYLASNLFARENLVSKMYLSTNLSWCRIHLTLLTELLNEHCCPRRTSDKIVRFFTLGYYPPSDTKEYTEDSPPSSADALTTLCADWENSAKLPDGCETRLVTLRIGVVLGRGGGVIQQTIWPFWLGLGGKKKIRSGHNILLFHALYRALVQALYYMEKI